MGYDDKGQCPMLVGNECSIYEHRPQTCRDYDCRVFAATGIPVDENVQSEIAQRVAKWVFNYDTEEDRAEHTMLRSAAAFLTNNSDLFPRGSLPSQPGPLAALAVRIYRAFAAITATGGSNAVAASDAAVAERIMTLLSEQKREGNRRRKKPSPQ